MGYTPQRQVELERQDQESVLEDPEDDAHDDHHAEHHGQAVVALDGDWCEGVDVEVLCDDDPRSRPEEAIERG